MTGVSLLRMAEGAAGSGGALGPMSWTNIFGDVAGVTNTQTVSGITGTISVDATVSSYGALHIDKNGTICAFTGPFPVSNGDTLLWEITNATTANVTGTITVKDATHSTTIDTFTYLVRPPA
jgi:hypothetical protein